MPELHRAQIAGARLVANPGCYATSIILALKPLVAAGLIDLDHGIVADSKSGVSGAGKAPTAKTHFMYAADNLSAYGVFTHRHTGELLEQIGSTKARSSSRRICFPFRAEFFPQFMCASQHADAESISQVYHVNFLPTVRWCASTKRRCRRFSIRCAPITPTSASSSPRWPPRRHRQLSR
jgi:N-acetyl-gamma-glutamylphosphate reductase